MISISNTGHWLIEQAALQPNKHSIITPEKILTYQNLKDESQIIANYFARLGIKKNDHVGILFDHNYKFLIAINAIWFIGAVPVPLNSRNTVEDIQSQIKQAGIKFLLIDETISPQFSKIKFKNKIRIIFDDVIKDQIIKSDTLNSQPCLPACSDLTESRRAGRFSIRNCSLIMFTSGSSGRPKAVIHTFQNLFESVRAIDSFANLQPSDIWLASLPFYHISGFIILIRSLIAGSSIAFPNSSKFEDILLAIHQFDPTHISLVPTTLLDFLNNGVSPDKNLKYVFLGGGPSDKQICIDAYEKGWPVVKVYGSTETCSMVFALNPSEIKLFPDSAGKPLGTNKIKIMNKSKNNGMGEIVVRSKSLFKKYYNDQSLTEAKLKNGWYYTGDYGRLDDENYLYVESRRKDLIITGGENVSAIEVETVIKSHPLVKDVFVFALNDVKWGQMICAAIVSEKISEEGIKIFLKEKLASYKIPKRFFVVPKIPRDDMGKIKQSELMKRLNLS